MSTLNEEIIRLKTAKANIDRVLIERGVSIPTGATLDTYHNLINSIKGGTSSSEVTATKANVLVGTRTITKDSGDAIVEGTMPNNGAVSQTITPSESVQSYTIPAGYHNGNGKVTVNAAEPVLRQITVTGYPGCCLYIDADGYVASALDAPSTYVIGADEVTIYARDGIVMFDGTDGGRHSSYYMCIATGEYDEYSTTGFIGGEYEHFTRLFRFTSNGSLDIEPMGV